MADSRKRRSAKPPTETDAAERQAQLREQADQIRRTPVWPSYDHDTQQAIDDELAGKRRPKPKPPATRPNTAKRHAEHGKRHTARRQQ